MPLFAVCAQCGKKKLSFTLSPDGVCGVCMAKESAEQKRIVQEELQEKEAQKAKVRADIINRVEQRQAIQMGLRQAWGPRAYGVMENYTVIDTETTGLDACRCEILEIGAIRYRSHREVARFHTYVHPYGMIPVSSIKINHIDYGTVSSAPQYPSTYADFLSFIGDDVLIGYNIDFDIKFLQTRAGEDIPNQIFDVLSLAKRSLNLDRFKLDDLRVHFHLSGAAHTALGDCETTAKVYQKLISMPGVANQLLQEAEEAEASEKEYERIVREKAEHLQKVKEEKNRLMAGAPTTKELHQLSAKMTGQAIEYFAMAKTILKAAGIDVSAVKEMNPTYNSRALYIPSSDPYLAQTQLAIFFGVKLEGSLRYILLDLSPDEIECDFVCVPSSIQEGEHRSRIYLPSPQSLDSISEYIIKSYHHAQETVDKKQ